MFNHDNKAGNHDKQQDTRELPPVVLLDCMTGELLLGIKYYLLVSEGDKHMVELAHFNQERAVQYCVE